MNGRPLRVVIAAPRRSSFPAADFGDRIIPVAAHTDEELRTAVRSADVLYSWSVPDTVPAESRHLRWIQLPSAGADHLRRQPVWHSDILITASQGIHSVPMSEHLFALILAFTRQIASYVRAQEEQLWVRGNAGGGPRPGELRGKTLAIIGWGKIGDATAHLARAFGMRVVGTRWSLMVPREAPGRPGLPYEDPPWVEPMGEAPDIVYPAAQLHEALAQSDIVVVLLPLTAATRGSFGEAEFAAMKRGALFFNLGRGAVVDGDALLAALRSGRLAGAGLDVFPQEPLPPSSPLWAMENVIISPHVGGVSDRTGERAMRLFTVNLARYLEGEPLLNVVHRERGY